MDSGKRNSTRAKAPRAVKRTYSSARRKPARKRRPSEIPDLQQIQHAFNEAIALVSVAYIAISRRNDYGPEEPVLRMGVAALNKVYDLLDTADQELHHIRKHIGGAS
jgi:hypothetical protein